MLKRELKVGNDVMTKSGLAYDEGSQGMGIITEITILKCGFIVYYSPSKPKHIEYASIILPKHLENEAAALWLCI